MWSFLSFYKLYVCYFGLSMIYLGVNLCYREYFNICVFKFVIFICFEMYDFVLEYFVLFF